MTLFEIRKDMAELIANSVDPETGELTLNEEALAELQMAEAEKITNIAWAYKNAVSNAKQLKETADSFTARYKSEQNTADRLKAYLDFALAGEKFKSEDGTVSISFRNSKKVELSDTFMTWAKTARPDLLRIKEPEADKVAIANALKAGDTIDGASLVDTTSIIIK